MICDIIMVLEKGPKFIILRIRETFESYIEVLIVVSGIRDKTILHKEGQLKQIPKDSNNIGKGQLFNFVW